MTRIKKIFLNCIISILAFGGLTSYLPAATKGTITVTGRVTDGTCRVDSGNESIVVNLGAAKMSDLLAVGMARKVVYFDVNLTHCPASVQGIQLMIDGDASSSGQLMVVGSATGVAIAILDMITKRSVMIGKTPVDPVQPDENGNVKFKFGAFYQTRDHPTTATPGSANATATFEIKYP